MRFKNIKFFLALALTFSAVFVACKKNETHPLQPDKASYCNATAPLLGTWISDSVVIVQKTDTVDTDAVNSNPGLTYRFNLSCEDNSGEADLEYFAFHSNNEITVIKSSNYSVENNNIYFFEDFDATRNIDNASLVIQLSSIEDSTMTMDYEVVSNPIQRSTYTIFLKKQP